MDTLSSDDFYLPAHQTLYTCFLELYRKNAPIDLVSVASYLKDHGQLEAVGGAAYLSELAQTVVSGPMPNIIPPSSATSRCNAPHRRVFRHHQQLL